MEDFFLPTEVLATIYRYSLHFKDGDKYAKSRDAGVWEWFDDDGKWRSYGDQVGS